MTQMILNLISLCVIVAIVIVAVVNVNNDDDNYEEEEPNNNNNNNINNIYKKMQQIMREYNSHYVKTRVENKYQTNYTYEKKPGGSSPIPIPGSK